MDVELGIIEGFYGRPWSWQARAETMAFLAPHGYRFYLYAPKADAYLRRRWTEPHPPKTAEALAGLAEACREAGVRFGIGLSPYEIFHGFDDDAREALARKLAFFDELRVDDVALLFDDMPGGDADLAEKQVEIVEWAAERTTADRILVCPTYYSDDPVLDRVFGARPAGYLERLGEALDPAIEILWTGEEVVSRAWSLGEELGARVREDLLTLQDVGLDRLGDKEAMLRERYAAADHPGAREIVAWLDGEYRITDEIVQTQ